MKKILISSYFVGMLLLAYLTAKAVSTYKSDNVEIKYRDHEIELTDTEIYQQNITPKEGKKVIQKWKTKETRTKGFLGWETQIETIEQPSTWYVDCGCK
jgi:transcription antitermination factor NusA-like protein